ncbi:MAG: DNA polymerase III subunit gamma/tau, partial [Bacilli bacterium]
MSYKALYRVWRPQLFQDLIGQQHVTQTLQNALREQRFSHAYLFNGPRGTGKTSAAKIMAKAVNCEKGKGSEPCNECSTCIGITNGSILDIVEIDAASNRGIDEIRELRDKVKYAPTEVQYKVYIIDEVHMLTPEAFNALLKTLEEPPSHVIFILATTEPHKLPLTIISRCQRFDFKRITIKEMSNRLRRITDETGIDISNQALIQVARSADGGMRDALSLLDQAFSFSSGKIEEEDVLSITGALGSTVYSTIGLKMANDETAELLSLIDQLMLEGRDPEKLLHDHITYMRDLLVYKVAPDLQEMKDKVMSDEQFAHVVGLYDEQQLFTLIQLCSESHQQMKWSTNPRILLELTMIKSCHALKNMVYKEPETEKQTSDLEVRIIQLEKRVELLQKQQMDIPVVVSQSKENKKNVTRPIRMASTSKVSTSKLINIAKEASESLLKQIQGHWNTIL